MIAANRVAVITGATGGLGRVAARRLAAQGARLALLGTNLGRLEQAAEALGLPAERYLLQGADLRDPGAARVAAGAVREKFGRADILLHLVGGWVPGQPVVELEAKTVADMLERHFWATLHVVQAFVPLLMGNGWGRVVAVSSPHVGQSPAGGAPFSIGKAAQEALITTLAQELQGTGVTANLLLVDTIDEEHTRDREPTAKNAAWTTPEEIAAAILYLCSDEARAVNGARIPLNGGGRAN